jgi:type II secretory pathway component GspD/PulD (secretin)
MNRSDLLNLGVEWGWPKIRAGAFSNSDLHGSGSPDVGGKWPWGVQIGYATGQSFTNSLELTLNLLERNGEATIVSSPQILAQDGKPAEIRVTTEEYFSLVPDVGEGQGSYYNRSELEKIEYGTVLNITPHIGRNGDITLTLSIEVSDVATRADNYPIVTRRVINNTMRIRDGGTVTVAGLKKHKSQTSDTSTPGLSKIPIVGGLFSNKRTTEISQEVAIFVTAHLIRDSVALVQPAKKVRNRTPSGQLTQEDFMADLEKNLSSQKNDR